VWQEEWHTRAPPPPLASPRRASAVCGIEPRAKLICFLFDKIIARVISYQLFPIFPVRELLLTWTWAASHILPDRHYISGLGVNPNHDVTHPSTSITLRCRYFRRAPDDRTVGLRNPASRVPVRVRGNRVFGERFGATTDGITSTDDSFPDDDFFPDFNTLYINVTANKVDVNANANTDLYMNPPTAPYVISSYLFQFCIVSCTSVWNRFMFMYSARMHY
jgi:hypothetical protein